MYAKWGIEEQKREKCGPNPVKGSAGESGEEKRARRVLQRGLATEPKLEVRLRRKHGRKRCVSLREIISRAFRPSPFTSTSLFLSVSVAIHSATL